MPKHPTPIRQDDVKAANEPEFVPTPADFEPPAALGGATAPALSAEDAEAAAEALLNEGDGQNASPDGNISVDELVTAYGAASLRAEKLQQIVIKQANEIQRLRATLRNVITAKKK